MARITRRDLFERIRFDFDVTPNHQEYDDFAIPSFYHLLNFNQDDAHPKLEADVTRIVKQFTKELRKRWRSSEVNRHLDRLYRIYSAFLDVALEIPELRVKVVESPADQNSSAAPNTQEAPDQNPEEGGQVQEADVPFIEKVS